MQIMISRVHAQVLLAPVAPAAECARPCNATCAHYLPDQACIGRLADPGAHPCSLHTLNALVVYLLLRGAVRGARAQETAPEMQGWDRRCLSAQCGWCVQVPREGRH